MVLSNLDPNHMGSNERGWIVSLTRFSYLQYNIYSANFLEGLARGGWEFSFQFWDYCVIHSLLNVIAVLRNVLDPDLLTNSINHSQSFESDLYCQIVWRYIVYLNRKFSTFKETSIYLIFYTINQLFGHNSSNSYLSLVLI